MKNNNPSNIYNMLKDNQIKTFIGYDQSHTQY
jgi:hypothetical protein